MTSAELSYSITGDHTSSPPCQLLVLVLVFGGLYAFSGPPPPGGGHHPPQDDVCTLTANYSLYSEHCSELDLQLTSECVVGAASILTSLNTKVSPCEDFYEFACGGWVAKNPIPDAKSRISSFDVLSDNNKRILRTILESPYTVSASVPPGQEAQDKANFELVTALYRTWYGRWWSWRSGVDSAVLVFDLTGTISFSLNETAINAAGAQPLVNLVDSVVKKFSDFGDATGYVHGLGVGVVFGMGVDADFVDPKTNTIYLSQDGLTLPSPEYYQDAEALGLLETVIAESLTLVLGQPAAGGITWADAAKRIVEFEKRLANITLPADELQ
ncbi:Endothelin-converting enzyme 2, partial [Gonapodya sp. JEL0774]